MVAPQPQPTSSSVMPGLQAELAERQIDLGDLCLFQRHVVALEVGAAVGLRRIEEEPEEVVGQVVMRLDVLEVRLQVWVCPSVSSGKVQPFGAAIVVFQSDGPARWFRPTLGWSRG